MVSVGDCGYDWRGCCVGLVEVTNLAGGWSGRTCFRRWWTGRLDRFWCSFVLRIRDLRVDDGEKLRRVHLSSSTFGVFFLV